MPFIGHAILLGSGAFVLTLAQIAARRWRAFLPAPISGAIIAASRIEFRGVKGGPNLAEGGTATASSEFSGSFLVENLFDGSTATAWATLSNSEPGWVEYDFGAGNELVIAEISITSRETSVEQSPNSINIESFDTIQWTDMGVFPQGAWTAAEERTVQSVQPPDLETSKVSVMGMEIYTITGAPASRVYAQSMEIYTILGAPASRVSAQAMEIYTILGAPASVVSLNVFEVYTILGAPTDAVSLQVLEVYTILGAPTDAVSLQILEVYTIVEV